MFCRKVLNNVVLLSSFLLVTPLYCVGIVAHGTFAEDEAWHENDGELPCALRSSYSKLPDSCLQKNAAIVSFHWSGHNNARARIRAAKDLAALILSYPDNEPIVIIAHSHGGNVVAIASKLLRNPLNEQPAPASSGVADLGVTSQQIDEAFVDLEPVRSLNFPAPHEIDALVGLPCNEEDRLAFYAAKQEVDDFYAQKAAENQARCCSLEGFSHKPLQFQKKITIAFFLGTPVNVVAYPCDMTVIERCYALHSSADFIQTVGGFYGRVFPPAKNLLNLKTVVITSGKNKVLGLGHSSMRGALVGAHLLLIPHLVEKELGIPAEKFDKYPMLILVLFEDGSTPVVVDELQKKGEFHPSIQKTLNEAKKNPASKKEAGQDFAKYYYDYSI